MLARPFYVKKLKRLDNGALVSDEGAELGVAVSEMITAVPDENTEAGVRFVATLGVVWSETRSPAISYEDPNLMENLGVLSEEYDGDYEDDESSEEIPEVNDAESEAVGHA